MNEQRLEMYWNDIPVEKENAADYPALCIKWDKNERDVRRILHDLSFYDNGDDYVLIRSGKVKGFYKTDNTEEIEAERMFKQRTQHIRPFEEVQPHFEFI